MNQEKVPGTFYEETYLAPEREKTRNLLANKAINAVAIVTGKEWSELVRSLIEQAHIRCNMPTYKTCVTDMIRANGFKPVRSLYSLKETVEACNKYFSLKRHYILNVGAGDYCALVPDEARKRYVLKGILHNIAFLDIMRVNETWLYLPGTDNRTGIKSNARSSRVTPESARLTVKNENPDGRNIGDCVVRALATAYGCTWHEAVDHLASASQYSEALINYIPNITATLTMLGFERHPGFKSFGRYPKGTQFCEQLNHYFHNGERIFAYFGTSHCAAVIPVEENGVRRYKVQDTWDSTSRIVTEFWVYGEKKQENAEPETPSSAFTVGERVVHPKFGEGTVSEITGEGNSRYLMIEFETEGKKKISEAWLLSQRANKS